MQLNSIDVINGGLSTEWNGGATRHFDAFWLRDHCDDAQSLDQQTKQRLVDTFDIDPSISILKASLISTPERVELDWSDNTSNTITVERLAGVVAHSNHGKDLALWQQGNLPSSLPSIDYEQVLASDKGVLEWLELIEKFGFAVVTNTKPTEDGAEKLGDRINLAQRTIFGTYWPLSAELSEHDDSAYSTSALLPHTDGTYYHNAAGLQMFNCLEFDGSGGESVLVDGFAIAHAMREECPEHFHTLCTVSVPGLYLEPGVHLQAERPAIQLDRHGEVQQISFNNYDRAPMLLHNNKVMTAFYAAYAEFNRRSCDQRHWLKIPLRRGTALIFNNWRCLHGRMGYTGKRVFYGCYHDKADFDSRLRTLRVSVH